MSQTQTGIIYKNLLHDFESMIIFYTCFLEESSSVFILSFTKIPYENICLSGAVFIGQRSARPGGVTSYLLSYFALVKYKTTIQLRHTDSWLKNSKAWQCVERSQNAKVILIIILYTPSHIIQCQSQIVTTPTHSQPVAKRFDREEINKCCQISYWKNKARQGAVGQMISTERDRHRAKYKSCCVKNIREVTCHAWTKLLQATDSVCSNVSKSRTLVLRSQYFYTTVTVSCTFTILCYQQRGALICVHVIPRFLNKQPFTSLIK